MEQYKEINGIGYPDDFSVEMLKEGGVLLERFGEDEDE